jgi:hypothetical protein
VDQARGDEFGLLGGVTELGGDDFERDAQGMELGEKLLVEGALEGFYGFDFGFGEFDFVVHGLRLARDWTDFREFQGWDKTKVMGWRPVWFSG